LSLLSLFLLACCHLPMWRSPADCSLAASPSGFGVSTAASGGSCGASASGYVAGSFAASAGYAAGPWQPLHFSGSPEDRLRQEFNLQSHAGDWGGAASSSGRAYSVDRGDAFYSQAETEMHKENEEKLMSRVTRVFSEWRSRLSLSRAQGLKLAAECEALERTLDLVSARPSMRCRTPCSRPNKTSTTVLQRSRSAPLRNGSQRSQPSQPSQPWQATKHSAAESNTCEEQRWRTKIGANSRRTLTNSEVKRPVKQDKQRSSASKPGEFSAAATSAEESPAKNLTPSSLEISQISREPLSPSRQHVMHSVTSWRGGSMRLVAELGQSPHSTLSLSPTATGCGSISGWISPTAGAAGASFVSIGTPPRGTSRYHPGAAAATRDLDNACSPSTPAAPSQSSIYDDAQSLSAVSGPSPIRLRSVAAAGDCGAPAQMEPLVWMSSTSPSSAISSAKSRASLNASPVRPRATLPLPPPPAASLPAMPSSSPQVVRIRELNMLEPEAMPSHASVDTVVPTAAPSASRRSPDVLLPAPRPAALPTPPADTRQPNAVASSASSPRKSQRGKTIQRAESMRQRLYRQDSPLKWANPPQVLSPLARGSRVGVTLPVAPTEPASPSLSSSCPGTSHTVCAADGATQSPPCQENFRPLLDQSAQKSSKLLAQEAQAKGNEAFQGKDYLGAIAHFAEGIDLDPSNCVLFSDRAVCLAVLGRYNEAFKDGQMCVDLRPDWPRGYGRRGLAEFCLGNYEKAVASYRQGLRLDPDDPALNAGLQQALDAIQAACDSPTTLPPQSPQFESRAADATRQHLQSVFDKCDANRDGKVSKAELIKALRRKSGLVSGALKLPVNIRQEDGSRDVFEQVFQGADADGDRYLTWEEFRSVFQKQSAAIEDLAQTHGSGADSPTDSPSSICEIDGSQTQLSSNLNLV